MVDNQHRLLRTLVLASEAKFSEKLIASSGRARLVPSHPRDDKAYGRCDLIQHIQCASARLLLCWLEVLWWRENTQSSSGCSRRLSSFDVIALSCLNCKCGKEGCVFGSKRHRSHRSHRGARESKVFACFEKKKLYIIFTLISNSCIYLTFFHAKIMESSW